MTVDGSTGEGEWDRLLGLECCFFVEDKIGMMTVGGTTGEGEWDRLLGQEGGFSVVDNIGEMTFVCRNPLTILSMFSATTTVPS